jgi:hypothetical protein
MLLISTPLQPKRMAGRAMAYGTPLAFRCSSTSPFPRKYGYGEAGSAWVIDTWTMR